MPNTNRAVVALDATPPTAELLAARSHGMTYLAWCAAGKPVSKTGAVSKTGVGKQKPRINPFAPYRSKWEQQYAEYLATSVAAKRVLDWRYEPERLEIGIGAVYTPDFSVLLSGADRIEYREVKGYRREAAIVRIKAAALRYPQFRFVLVTKLNGDWKHTTIGAR